MDSQQPEVVIEDPRMDPGRLMYAEMPYEEGPQFRISEVAKTFFGKTPHWMRWLQTKNALVFDGREVGNRLSENNNRIYGLRDIEEIAHGLAQQRRLDGMSLRATLAALDAVGKLWNVRDVDWPAVLRTRAAAEVAAAKAAGESEK